MADADVRATRLAALKQEAEAQMRRPAPALGEGGPAAKRARRGGGGGRGGGGAEAADGGEEAAGAPVPIQRFNYGAPLALLAGAPCLLLTCAMQREVSATKEAVELIRPRLPPGVAVSSVKAGCRGVALLLLQRKGQAAPGGEQEPPTDAAPAPAGAAPAKGGGGAEGDGAAAVAAAEVDAVGIAASILADIESGKLPRCRFVERIGPVATTCALRADALRAAAEAVCGAYVAGLAAAPTEGAPIEFAVAYKSRESDSGPRAAPAGEPGQGGAAESGKEGGGGGKDEKGAAAAAAAGQAGEAAYPQRGEIISILAGAMTAAAGGHAKVNLKSPSATILAEIVPVLMNDRWQPLAALAAVDTARLIAVKSRGLQVRTVSKP
ncbi:hypothetical protein Rsub_01393 [Raphidocelis subcapitata]|uniref:THUMP domain-containing protein n=1 Tax=Raphidocelis subcapitata TaxID=307507 RepID=A0A2V0NMZ0_9CHLO|nr:hypothetical protein Rsub_01393 [Raphidocelis subcapitata]|eukprot:GBF88894.1 hypothetical protein Rsub_01393 [Raphidocelis subcapitata]